MGTEKTPRKREYVAYAPRDVGPDEHFEPKPLTWLRDWMEDEYAPLQPKEGARGLWSLGYNHEWNEEFDQAKYYYRRAMAVDPEWATPPYYLSRVYKQAREQDRAAKYLKQAVELGFDDYPLAKSDQKLGSLRTRPEFPELLQEILRQYRIREQKKLGQPIAVEPQGEKPAAGWPVILLLHGYGDTNLSYVDNAIQWSRLGFLAVAVPGAKAEEPEAGDDYVGYSWCHDSTEPTRLDLEAILASPLLAGLINRRQVFLLGFSQGASHALMLAASTSDRYAGVVGISPGPMFLYELERLPPTAAREKLSCAIIYGTAEGGIMREWAEACRNLEWRFECVTHPGAHHFPENWTEIRPRIAEFLLDQSVK